MSGALLSVMGLHAGYGAIGVLHDVSLEVEEGSITALIGSNGAGKSTLLRCLAGLIGSTRGGIQFAGTDITGLPTNRRVEQGIVLVPEGRLIFTDFTVDENLRIGAFAPRSRAGAAQRLEEIYQLFPNLALRRRQSGGTLSGGEQQMLALGRGLMSKPRLLLLDEPSLGLAPLIVKVLFELIETVRASGVSVLLAEQEVRATLGIADYAYVLENGQGVLAGEGTVLLHSPKVRETYLGLMEEESHE